MSEHAQDFELSRHGLYLVLVAFRESNTFHSHLLMRHVVDSEKDDALAPSAQLAHELVLKLSPTPIATFL